MRHLFGGVSWTRHTRARGQCLHTPVRRRTAYGRPRAGHGRCSPPRSDRRGRRRTIGLDPGDRAERGVAKRDVVCPRLRRVAGVDTHRDRSGRRRSMFHGRRRGCRRRRVHPGIRARATRASSTSSTATSRTHSSRRRSSPRRHRGRLGSSPHLIPLVEVLGNDHTDDGVVAAARAFYESVGKVTIEVRKEVPGHVANRLQAALWREAGRQRRGRGRGCRRCRVP